jgi:rubrerythrin
MTTLETWQDAVQLAMKAEDEAARFYTQAAENTRHPRGRDMLRQLAKFERGHFRHLQEMLETPDGGMVAAYAGNSFDAVPPGLPAVDLGAPEIKSDLAALEVAIKAETKAHQAYLDLARKVNQAVIRETFLKLAEEEELHRRILEDQVYSLSNRGVWVWGD